MPFPDTRSAVVFSFEKLWDGVAGGIDKPSAGAIEDAAFETGALGVATGEKAVTGGGADGGIGVEIGEAHPVRSERVEMRGSGFCAGIIDAEITVAHVIDKDDDDVWFLRGEE